VSGNVTIQISLKCFMKSRGMSRVDDLIAACAREC
jgi:hypothetical protein